MSSYPELIKLDSHAPAANTAAVVTLPAVTGRRYKLGYVWWSYDGTPTGGNLLIEGTEPDDFEVDVTAGGPGFLPLNIKTELGAAVTITLAAGSGSVSGKVNISWWLD